MSFRGLKIYHVIDGKDPEFNAKENIHYGKETRTYFYKVDDIQEGLVLLKTLGYHSQCDLNSVKGELLGTHDRYLYRENIKVITVDTFMNGEYVPITDNVLNSMQTSSLKLEAATKKYWKDILKKAKQA